MRATGFIAALALVGVAAPSPASAIPDNRGVRVAIKVKDGVIRVAAESNNAALAVYRRGSGEVFAGLNGSSGGNEVILADKDGICGQAYTYGGSRLGLYCKASKVRKVRVKGTPFDDDFYVKGLQMPAQMAAGAGDDHFRVYETKPRLRINGGDGLDRINGGSGDDELNGGPGQDTISGGSGKDKIDGGTDSDKIYGSKGDDALRGNSGADRIFGGGGVDLVDYSGKNEGVLVALSKDVMSGEQGEGDRIDRDVEGVIGSPYNDQLVGNPNNNSLFGLGGNDALDGGLGSDSLRGGDGDDTLAANDGTVDQLIDCELGTDTAFADAFDPPPSSCETVLTSG